MPKIKFSRKAWMRFHAYLSILFLPFAAVYTYSGILYLLDAGDSYERKTVTLYDLEPDAPETIEDATPLVKETVEANGYELPENAPEKGEKYITWRSDNGLKIDYRPSSSTEGKAYIKIRKLTLYGRAIDFHKGDGGADWMMWLGITFASLLMVSYLSGVVLAIQIPSMRIGSALFLAAGFILVYYSLF